MPGVTVSNTFGKLLIFRKLLTVGKSLTLGKVLTFSGTIVACPQPKRQSPKNQTVSGSLGITIAHTTTGREKLEGFTHNGSCSKSQIQNTLKERERSHVAKLSEQEQALLKKLTAKAEAPDEPPIGRSVSATIDFGDKDQLELAKRYGFLPADEVDDSDADTSDKGDKSDDKDEVPRRKGYFGD